LKVDSSQLTASDERAHTQSRESIFFFNYYSGKEENYIKKRSKETLYSTREWGGIDCWLGARVLWQGIDFMDMDMGGQEKSESAAMEGGKCKWAIRDFLMASEKP
jgi:hypothetical protein